MSVSKISSKGQVSIPKDVRAALGLNVGDKVSFHVRNGTAVLIPIRSRTAKELRGAFRSPSPVTELGQIREQRAKDLAEKFRRGTRFLQDHPPEQALAAQRLFDRAAAGEFQIVVHPSVLAEVVYVASSPHGLGLDRTQVASILRQFLNLEDLVVPDLPYVIDALQRFETTTLDWVDALLLAHSADCIVYSFDKQMLRAGAVAPDPTEATG